MAFGGFNGGQDQPMAEINMIPLVDVMLVLLVIFIITAPVLTHAVKVNMPVASSEPNTEIAEETISLAVAADGALYWNGEPVAADVLEPRLAAAVRHAPERELHLQADRLTPYEHVARVMATARRAGIRRIGFLTEPQEATP